MSESRISTNGVITLAFQKSKLQDPIIYFVLMFTKVNNMTMLPGFLIFRNKAEVVNAY